MWISILVISCAPCNVAVEPWQTQHGYAKLLSCGANKRNCWHDHTTCLEVACSTLTSPFFWVIQKSRITSCWPHTDITTTDPCDSSICIHDREFPKILWLIMVKVAEFPVYEEMKEQWSFFLTVLETAATGKLNRKFGSGFWGRGVWSCILCKNSCRPKVEFIYLWLKKVGH